MCDLNREFELQIWKESIEFGKVNIGSLSFSNTSVDNKEIINKELKEVYSQNLRDIRITVDVNPNNMI